MKRCIMVFACVGSFLNISAVGAAELNCEKGAALGSSSSVDDCEAMGYTMTSIATSRYPDKDFELCGDGKINYCPSDKTKLFCVPKSPLPILYGDGSLSYFIDKTKTPVGVVFDEENKLAMALTNVKQDGTAGDEKMSWSSVAEDTPLMNCSAWKYKNTCGISGYLNTKVLLKQTSGTYYAAKAANTYQPVGCTASFCKKGKWFLPSALEYDRWRARSYLTTVSGNLLATTLSMGWLSTEESAKYAFGNWRSSTNKISTSSSSQYTVRPIVYYGEGEIDIPVLPILYGDGTVSKTPVSGKTPIGIVFDETKRLAIALTDVNKSGNAGSEVMRWGPSSDTSLKNCTNDNLDTCDTDGSANTATVLKLVSSTDQYAFNAVNKFEPSGCSAAFCKKGKWFLPSYKEWSTIKGKEVEATGALNIGSAFKRFAFLSASYWTSNEVDAKQVWTTSSNDYATSTYKSLNTYVRAAVKY